MSIVSYNFLVQYKIDFDRRWLKSPKNKKNLEMARGHKLMKKIEAVDKEKLGWNQHDSRRLGKRKNTYRRPK